LHRQISELAAALEPADFGDEVSCTIYGAMLRLHSAGKPVDITLVVGDTTLCVSSTFIRETSAPIC
jgi:replicative DNA helicase